MLQPDTLCFPNNVVALLASAAQDIDPDIRVVKRPVRVADSTQTIGISPTIWTPEQDSLEMRGGPNEPTLQNYGIAVQGFVKEGDEADGIAVHSLLAYKLREMLYRDPGLRVALPLLSVTLNGSTEKLVKWKVISQPYLNNEYDSKFLFLSTAELWIQTAIY